MNSLIWLNELIGRGSFASFLKQLNVDDCYFPQEIGCPFDCVFFFKGKKYLVEIKVREKLYNDFVLEKKKYEAVLNKEKEEQADGSFYAVFYGNKLFLYNLHKITAKTQMMMLNEKTFQSREKKVNKEVFLLPQKDAVQFQLLDKWVTVK